MMLWGKPFSASPASSTVMDEDFKWSVSITLSSISCSNIRSFKDLGLGVIYDGGTGHPHNSPHIYSQPGAVLPQNRSADELASFVTDFVCRVLNGEYVGYHI
jgi:hypothetical protein